MRRVRAPRSPTGWLATAAVPDACGASETGVAAEAGAGAVIGASPRWRLAEESALDERGGHDQDEQDHAHRRCVAEVEVADGCSVQEQDGRGERVVRLAARASHEDRLVEELERPDHRHGGHEVVPWPEKRERDSPERLPRVGTVDRGSLVDLVA